VGLRPGEKLTEELFFEDENPSRTEHKKIFIAKTEFEHLERLRRDVIKIGKERSGLSRGEIRRRLFDLINLYS
jgi:FlaA1/EpsC-like NDP-sugar epimerase